MLSHRKFFRILACLVFVALQVFPASAWIHGSSTPIAAMGTNLNGISNFGTEHAFLNEIKNASRWYTAVVNTDTNEEPYLYSNMTDSNHYPTTLTATGTAVGGTGGVSSTSLTVASVSALLWVGGTISGTGITGSPTITACPAGGCGVAGTYTMSSAQTIANGTTISEAVTFTDIHFAILNENVIRTGNYVFLCNGTDTFVLSGNSVSQAINCGTNTRTIVAVTNAAGGQVTFKVSSIGATHTTSIAFIYSPDSTNSVTGVNEALYNAGETLNPLFVSVTKGTNRSIRFMDWNSTNVNTVQNWSDRAQPSWIFYGDQFTTDDGAPVELEINICNEVGAQYCWFAIPCLATDNFFVQHADLTLANLNSGVNVVPETCNEAWNQAFSSGISSQMTTWGSAIFAGLSGNQFAQILSFANMRAVQLAQIYKQEWGGNSSRVYPVQGGQDSFSDRNNYLLQNTPFFNGSPFGTLTGVISGCPSSCLLTASGITGTSTLQLFSRISGAGLTVNRCWVVSFGTGAGGNGTYNLGGAGCANVSSEAMTAQMWGTAPAAVGSITMSGSTATINSTSSGAFANGQYLWLVGVSAGSNFSHGNVVSSLSGSTFTVSGGFFGPTSGTYTVVAANASDVDAAQVYALATAPYFASQLPLALTGDADGGVARAIQQATSGGIIPPCTGASCATTAPTTGGSTNAYTLTTGNGYTGSIANGTCTGVTFATNNTNTATIAVDSVGALPLADYLGNAVNGSNLINGGGLTGGLVNVICYTNKTGAGTVTASWYLNRGQFAPSATGDVNAVITAWSADYSIAQAMNVKLFGYEGGQSYDDNTGNVYIRSLISNMNRSAGMGTAYTQWMTGLKGVVAGTPITHFNDIGPYAIGFAWGALEYVQEGSSTPKYNALATFPTH